MPKRSTLYVAVLAILMCYGFLKGLSPSQVINLQSLAIVVGGLCLFALIGFPTSRVKETILAVKEAAGRQFDSDAEFRQLLSEILSLSRIYRLKGPASLEKAAEEVNNPFLRFGATLVAEGYDRWSLLAALNRQKGMLEGQRRSQVRLLSTLVRLAPSLGMAGTVVSLMQVMQDLGSSQIGPSMTLALSSTLYGILLANLVFLPMASKIEELSRHEAEQCGVVIEAVMGIHEGLHPLRIAERLNAYELYIEMIRDEIAADSSESKGATSPEPDLLAQAVLLKATKR